jgi:hypothetical protein
MKIKKETILDLTEKFSAFVDSMQGSNYVAWIEVRKFEYEDNIYFSLNNLREIFSDVLINSKNYIEGEIMKSTFSLAQEEIKDSLSWVGQRGGNVSALRDSHLTHARTIIFWNLIEKNFDIKLITKVFKHQAQFDSYFGDFFIWGFCYIFLNEHDKIGLVISGGASY